MHTRRPMFQLLTLGTLTLILLLAMPRSQVAASVWVYAAAYQPAPGAIVLTEAARERRPKVPRRTALGVSYAAMMEYLSRIFHMERSSDVQGQQRYMGQTTSKTAVLEIIGDHQDIAKTTLLVAFPNDNHDLAFENFVILHRFLKNAVPGWGQSAAWANTGLQNVSVAPAKSVSTRHQGKVITMSLVEYIGGVIVAVEPQK